MNEIFVQPCHVVRDSQVPKRYHNSFQSNHTNPSVTNQSHKQPSLRFGEDKSMPCGITVNLEVTFQHEGYIIYLKLLAVSELAKEAILPNSIVIINFWGLHAVLEDAGKTTIQSFEEKKPLFEHLRKVGCLLIFRETTAVKFDNLKYGGYFSPDMPDVLTKKHQQPASQAQPRNSGRGHHQHTHRHNHRHNYTTSSTLTPIPFTSFSSWCIPSDKLNATLAYEVSGNGPFNAHVEKQGVGYEVLRVWEATFKAPHECYIGGTDCVHFKLPSAILRYADEALVYLLYQHNRSQTFVDFSHLQE